MLARDVIDSHQSIDIQAVVRVGEDYSSCWSALPDVLRSQVESLLESNVTIATERTSRHALAIGP